MRGALAIGGAILVAGAGAAASSALASGTTDPPAYVVSCAPDVNPADALSTLPAGGGYPQHIAYQGTSSGADAFVAVPGHIGQCWTIYYPPTVPVPTTTTTTVPPTTTTTLSPAQQLERRYCLRHSTYYFRHRAQCARLGVP